MLKYLFIVALLVPILSWAQTTTTEKLTLDEILRRNRIACGDSVYLKTKFRRMTGFEYFMNGKDTVSIGTFTNISTNEGYHYQHRTNGTREILAAVRPNNKSWIWENRNPDGPVDAKSDLLMDYIGFQQDLGSFFSEENVKTFSNLENKYDITFMGVACIGLSFIKDGSSRLVLLNKKTYLMEFGVIAEGVDPKTGNPKGIITHQMDYRNIGGMLFPFRQEYNQLGDGGLPYLIVVYTERSISDTIDYSLFEKPVISK